ncbi:MAG: glycosyltransferase family 2 protein, partial [Melioribacteraceae bacterium]|nr:glycosyltransferase family 2 protein [Melioribacteraceae bacterium]
MSQLSYRFEIILVDDGSRDNTYINAVSIANKDERVKVVKLKKNYGQTTGLHAGFQNAIGKYIVTMDGDLQNDPSDIGKMMEKLEDGNDICLGWRENRQDSKFTRLLPSKIANGLVRGVTGIPVRDNGCAIRSYKAETINRFPMYSEMHRLLPVINALTGASFTQIPVKHHSRKFGESKYGLSRIYKVILDLIALKTVFSSFNKPLFGFGGSVVISGILFLISSIITLFIWILNPGYPLVVLLGTAALMGILTLTLSFLGIICHLIYKSGNLKIERMYKLKVSKA